MVLVLVLFLLLKPLDLSCEFFHLQLQSNVFIGLLLKLCAYLQQFVVYLIELIIRCLNLLILLSFIRIYLLFNMFLYDIYINKYFINKYYKRMLFFIEKKLIICLLFQSGLIKIELSIHA